jgi:hypothetical protein
MLLGFTFFDISVHKSGIFGNFMGKQAFNGKGGGVGSFSVMLIAVIIQGFKKGCFD